VEFLKNLDVLIVLGVFHIRMFPYMNNYSIKNKKILYEMCFIPAYISIGNGPRQKLKPALTMSYADITGINFLFLIFNRNFSDWN
jgi:hypothetical protein